MKVLRAVAAGALFSIVACSDKAKDRATADSTLARDLALAGAQPVQPAQPTFQDTTVAPAPQLASRAKEVPPAPVHARAGHRPVTHAPRTVAQAPTPQPAPAPMAEIPAAAPMPSIVSTREIGIGAKFSLSSGSKVCTSTNLPGDKLVATLASDVTGTNGAMIPAGSSVVLEVASATSGQNGDGGQITFRVRSIVVGDKTYPIAADVTALAPLQTTKVQNSDPNADKKKVIGGAIAGAILGQIFSHNTRGTIIGAAAGGVAGAAASKMGEKSEGCLPAGTPMRLTLNQPIVLS